MEPLKAMILLTICIFLIALTITRMVMDLLFGRPERVKYIPMPPPMITEETLILWSKYDPERLKEYLEKELKPMWVSSK